MPVLLETSFATSNATLTALFWLIVLVLGVAIMLPSNDLSSLLNVLSPWADSSCGAIAISPIAATFSAFSYASMVAISLICFA